MRKGALLLACIMAIGLATSCLAQRGGGRGGRGGRGIGMRGGRRRGGFVAGGWGRGRGRGWGRGRGRGWGRGRGGFGIGFGWGRGRGRGWGRGWRRRPWGWRRRGWGWDYPYWRGGWWSPGVAWSVDTYRDYIDNAGQRFWEITNNTPNEIWVRSERGGPQIKINPGATGSLKHPYCFVFTVRTPDGSQAFTTRNHYISVELDASGELIAETWT